MIESELGIDHSWCRIIRGRQLYISWARCPGYKDWIDRIFQQAYPPSMKYFFCAALGIVLCSNLFAAEKAIGTGANFKGPLGLQMYSLRFYSPDNLLAKFDKV